jgi:hypothetical protein
MTIRKCKQKGVVEGKWNKLKVGGGFDNFNVVVSFQLLNYVIINKELLLFNHINVPWCVGSLVKIKCLWRGI